LSGVQILRLRTLALRSSRFFALLALVRSLAFSYS
ncbi:hypothetical protein A2U01_0107148, partial [Trifolium medium]|nr:hypothetical protein [Trifolium medium]